MRRSLRILIALPLLAAVVALTWLAGTDSGLHWAYQNVKNYLPGELSLGKIEGRLIGPITVIDTEYQQDGVTIKADQLTLDWQPRALLTSKISINSLHIQSLKIVLPKPKENNQPVVLPEIHLPWRLALRGVAIDHISINRPTQTIDLKQIKLDATTLFNQIDVEKFSVNLDNLSLNIKGELRPTQKYRHDLKIHWRAKLPSNEVIDGNGRLSGTIETTHLKQKLSGPFQLTLIAEARDLLDKLSWETKINASAFNTSKLDDDWPAVKGKLELNGKGDLTTATFSGNLNAEHSKHGAFTAEFKLQRLADNTLQIDHLTLLTPTNNTPLRVSGQWLPGADGGNITLALNWHNLHWPFKEKIWFNSTIGSAWIMGNLNHYDIGLATNSPWPQAPPSDWYVSAEGNLDGLSIHSLRVTALEGEAIATGQLNWSPHLAWQAQISATHIDPSELWPQWPGLLNTELTSGGKYVNDSLTADTNIAHVKGSLRGYPVSLSSRLNWRDNGLDINQLDIQSGTSQISTKGRLANTVNLDWTITSPDLAALYPQAHGQFNSIGQIRGLRTTPTIRATFNGQAMSFADNQIGMLDGALDIDLHQWQQLNINLAAQDLKLKGHPLQTLNIISNGQRIKAKAVSEYFTALIELHGKADSQGWRGRIEKAEVVSQEFHHWLLNTPATLHLTRDSLIIEPLCWLSQDRHICVALQKNNDHWLATLNAKKLPLRLFSPWLIADIKLEGGADVQADIQIQSAQIKGKADIQLPPGLVSYPLPGGERDSWEYHDGSLAISLDDYGLKARSEINTSNGDRLLINAELPGAPSLPLDFERQRLRVEALMNINNLSLIETLIPEVQNLQGEIALNLSATGTLAQPKLNIQSRLVNGALHIPRLGLNIEQLNLKSQSKGLEKLNFKLDALSGTGSLVLQGQSTLDMNAGWPTEITITGKDFEVSRIPEAQVLVSPNLHVKIKKRIVNITGDVHIPYANMQPNDITTAVHASEDVVIIGGEQPTTEKWSINTSIHLSLGERVNFYGFGFEGRFGGKLLLEDEPGQLTKATGEISIPEGRYRAYGQRLDVEYGRLLYTGGPLTNPGLDLRAVRHVSDITAGLKVRGNIKKPQVELFSIPVMGQTDVLAYLVLGRPIESATDEEGTMMAKATLALGLSGGNQLARTLSNRFGLDEMRIDSTNNNDQASLLMGRYLSPRLYISYGVGLIEAFNTLSVRYQISDQWQLKAESGEYQGADFLYTIER